MLSAINMVVFKCTGMNITFEKQYTLEERKDGRKDEGGRRKRGEKNQRKGGEV